MKYIIRKASISMITGATSYLGAWLAKQILSANKQENVEKTRKQKEERPT